MVACTSTCASLSGHSSLSSRGFPAGEPRSGPARSTRARSGLRMTQAGRRLWRTRPARGMQQLSSAAGDPGHAADAWWWSLPPVPERHEWDDEPADRSLIHSILLRERLRACLSRDGVWCHFTIQKKQNAECRSHCIARHSAVHRMFYERQHAHSGASFDIVLSPKYNHCLSFLHQACLRSS